MKWLVDLIKLLIGSKKETAPKIPEQIPPIIKEPVGELPPPIPPVIETKAPEAPPIPEVKAPTTPPPVTPAPADVNKGSPEKPDWGYIIRHSYLDEGVKNRVMDTVARIMNNFEVYKECEVLTGVPWYATAVWHLREADLDLKRCIHNGEKIIGKGRVTKLVPKGRGPFKTFQESVVDSYTYEGLTKIKNWTVEMVVIKSEAYNGLGYRKKKGDKGKVEYSPYMTAGTNWSDETSKYVEDGVYDPNAVEKQLGVIAVLIGMGIIAENRH